MASESTTLIAGFGVGFGVGLGFGLMVALYFRRRGMITEFAYTDERDIKRIIEKPLAT